MGSSRSGVQAIKRGKSFLVQVKTRLTYEKQLKSFVLGEKNEKFADENFFYCFVVDCNRESFFDFIQPFFG